MTIRLVYFDLGNVLLAFTHQQGYDQIATAAGLSSEAVKAALTDSGLNDRYERGALTTSEFHQAFREATGARITEQQLSLAWSAIFTLKSRTIGLAAALAAAGHRIGILSNTSEAHWSYARRQYRVLDQLFRPTVTSFGVRAMKPESAIYQAAEDMARLRPDELLFVDDRPENIAGARARGWHAELYQNAHQLTKVLDQHGLSFNR